MKPVEPKVKTVAIDQIGDMGYADKLDKLFGENKEDQSIIDLSCKTKLMFDKVNSGYAKNTDKVRNSSLVFMTPRSGDNMVIDMFGLFPPLGRPVSAMLTFKVDPSFPRNLKHKAYALISGKIKMLDLNRFFPSEGSSLCLLGMPEDGLKMIIFQPQGLIGCEYKNGLLKVVNESAMQDLTSDAQTEANASTPETPEDTDAVAPDQSGNEDIAAEEDLTALDRLINEPTTTVGARLFFRHDRSEVRADTRAGTEDTITARLVPYGTSGDDGVYLTESES